MDDRERILQKAQSLLQKVTGSDSPEEARNSAYALAKLILKYRLELVFPNQRTVPEDQATLLAKLVDDIFKKKFFTPTARKPAKRKRARK